ncbi:MAG: hypothetical protein BWZ07_03340 [Alphaproteobacteria bacterium ADurb.BinA280]|nr:MAG: hypothetical protein BWZ07_03340 [Alphaproteobacteria bacterium ADurb.BinA280]
MNSFGLSIHHEGHTQPRLFAIALCDEANLGNCREFVFRLAMHRWNLEHCSQPFEWRQIVTLPVGIHAGGTTQVHHMSFTDLIAGG